ncbi:MAG: glycosyltransferase family 4 protein [Chloroflexota bacterium]|nr:glycosyltransferase family 4 protein [Chloroflexota bacterium]
MKNSSGEACSTITAMKIVVASRAVAPLHGVGGLERAVADVCSALADRGHHVTLVTATPTQGMADDSLLRVNELITVPWADNRIFRRGGVLDRVAHYPRFVRRVTEALKAGDTVFDAAIGHGAAAAAFVPLLDTGQVRRLLINPHGMEEFSATGLKRALLTPQRALVRRAARHADRAIALDAFLVPDVMRNLGLPRDRVAIVPNGIDVARVDRLTGTVSPPHDEPPVLVSLARIEPNKGLDVLAAALGMIGDQLPNGWRWLHIGDGAARPQVEAAITRADIGAHATLLGRLSDEELHRTLATATLFVHPTRYEGSPLVMLEAMVHRLPIVASAVGGIPDKVIPDETGWLVPPDDPAALGAAIRSALSQPPAILRAVGERGRARVLAHFSLTQVVDELITLLGTIPPRDERC